MKLTSLSLSLSLAVCLLQDDSEFRDKITPIAVFMEYRLDYKTAADKTGLLPILDQSTPANVTKQVLTAVVGPGPYRPQWLCGGLTEDMVDGCALCCGCAVCV